MTRITWHPMTRSWQPTDPRCERTRRETSVASGEHGCVGAVAKLAAEATITKTAWRY